MIQHIEIENYKAFKKLNMDDLRRITLISGKNNIGKSTLLEAIFLHIDHNAADSFIKVNGFRGANATGALSVWTPLFYRMDTSKTIKIAVQDEEGTAVLAYSRDDHYRPEKAEGVSEDIVREFHNASMGSYSIKYSFEKGDFVEDGHFLLNGNDFWRQFKSNRKDNGTMAAWPTKYFNAAFARMDDSLMNGIGKLELEGKKNEIIDILKIMDPDVKDIVTISVEGATYLYLRYDNRMVPLRQSGDGMIKLLNICLSMIENASGLILVDEIETGLHYSMYGEFWRIISQISKKVNCQVIATTHSYEMISAIRGSNELQDDFAYYRLGKKNEDTIAYRYDYAMLDSALDAEMEVR